MTNYQAEVRVTPRAGLLDPEGKAIESALHTLEFPDAEHVRVGRLFHLRVTAGSAQEAEARVDMMCKKLLANPVTEDYEIALKQVV